MSDTFKSAFERMGRGMPSNEKKRDPAAEAFLREISKSAVRDLEQRIADGLKENDAKLVASNAACANRFLR